MAGNRRANRRPVDSPQPPREECAPKTNPAQAAATTALALATSSDGQVPPPIVGVGASAGGLAAFNELFSALPADSGMAFVLVPHLDPAHQSLLPELIGRMTAMKVAEVADETPVQPNCVYVIPPNKDLQIQGGVLRLTGPVAPTFTAIDLFLRSLALDQRERAVGIILSGTGSHGVLGLRDIKAQGGIAIVQDPRTAEFCGMPQSAIDAGLADFVLPAHQMPAALAQHAQSAFVKGLARVPADRAAPDQLSQILALLRVRSNFDFRNHRRHVVQRRIERRMSLVNCENGEQYLQLLRENAGEVRQLSNDLLCTATGFFRDPEAFAALDETVIAPLVHEKGPVATIRIWVPGCATGEEVYSIGMLLIDRLSAAKKACPVRIFATDVDPHALEVARRGIYPDAVAADVSPARVRRFFNRLDESSLQVRPELRDIVTFAVQNVISDAPFAKLDLISCRNLLGDLTPETADKVISVFHYSLNENGALFLGTAEAVDHHGGQFQVVSRRWRVYRQARGMQRVGGRKPISAWPEHQALPMAHEAGGALNFAELTNTTAPPKVDFYAKPDFCYKANLWTRF